MNNPDENEAQVSVEEIIAALEAQSAGLNSIESQAAIMLTRLQKMALEGLDLAGLASYAEIVGGIGVNRTAIRKACDRVFVENNKLSEPMDFKPECYGESDELVNIQSSQ